MLSLLKAFLLAGLVLENVLCTTQRPIIGILTDPNLAIDYKEANIKDPTDEYIPKGYTHSIPTHYVQWLNGAGARVVPIPYNGSQEDVDFLLSRVNGVLFTGGDLSLKPGTTYLNTATYIYNKLIEMNDMEKQTIPLWGTCMGLQLMSIIQAKSQDILSRGKFHTYSNNLPLFFTQDYKHSRLFGSAPAVIRDVLKSENSTVNLHKDGVEPSRFRANTNISSFFHILSYNYDVSSVPFVSAIEAYEYPFYAVQFHPERPGFDFKVFGDDILNRSPYKLEPITHSFEAILAGAYFADFFVSEARKNDHSFKQEDKVRSKYHNKYDLAPEDPFLINNHHVYFFGNAIESYWFK